MQFTLSYRICNSHYRTDAAAVSLLLLLTVHLPQIGQTPTCRTAPDLLNQSELVCEEEDDGFRGQEDDDIGLGGQDDHGMGGQDDHGTG